MRIIILKKRGAGAATKLDALPIIIHLILIILKEMILYFTFQMENEGREVTNQPQLTQVVRWKPQVRSISEFEPWTPCATETLFTVWVHAREQTVFPYPLPGPALC